MQKRAYAYIRFSSASQRSGDSLRRQLDSCRDYAHKNGYILDEREFKDFAKSAYTQANLSEGSALSAFLALVEKNEITPESCLIIESIDRLTRADIYSAFTLFGSILKKGVNIAVISTNTLYTKDSLSDISDMIQVLVHTLRSHDESKVKSVRSGANWQRRQKNAIELGTPITRECPRWLKVSKDGKSYIVDKELVKNIKYVFSLRKSGFGASSIARNCNEKKLKPPGKGEIWHLSLINRLIRNRALIGEYQPHKLNKETQKREPYGEPISAYYPAVLDRGLFDSVQQINSQSKQFPGRRDNAYRNFLQGLLYCSCGVRMHRKLKSELTKDYARYYCSSSLLNATKCPSLSTNDIEHAVIWFMSEKAPEYIKFDDETQKYREAEASTLARLEDVKIQISRLVNVITSTEEPLQQLVEKHDNLKAEKEQLESHAIHLQEVNHDVAKRWGVKADMEFITAIYSNDTEKLATLRFHIARVLERIDISKDCCELKFTMKNGNTTEVVMHQNYFDLEP